eukprot:CAMPEP_0182486702 /NCGR_PEP_ID=MMETSP1319-20130603/47530_1 /TAXON_ID=172717 /ORGANISM="Bolidomonas pacifica, Strain RCC208" /LENGTH=414 /DNA_ID=CAMNT_0024688807 /DNA_START=96 /DNA_END=1341 /DNA_ORIENTATION=+
MPLESVLLLLDTSEPTRNSDYPPTRLSSQLDCANYLASSVTNGNPESTCGVMSMGGSAEVLTSLTTNLGSILGSLHGLPIKGDRSHVPTSLSVALLALKHRRNKNGGQRVVLFAASKSECTPKEMTKVGKQLKKNNVTVDVILMVPEDEALYGKLCEAAGEGSRVLQVPKGTLPDDGFEFGIDPSMDPELAMALRVSMEEERRRVEAEKKEKEEKGGGPTIKHHTHTHTHTHPPAPSPRDPFGLRFPTLPRPRFAFALRPLSMDPELAMALRVSMEEERRRVEAEKKEKEEKEGGEKLEGVKEEGGERKEVEEEVVGGAGDDALLQQALAMSVDGGGGGGGEPNPSFYETMTAGVTDEDEAMQLALAMSMAGGGGGGGGEGDEDAIKEVMGELDVDEDGVRKAMEEDEDDDKKK